MQKKYSNILLASLALLSITARAQETIYPAKAQKGITVITHATVHVGNGTVLNDASVSFENGKITAVGNITPAVGATIIDATGKHVYPGFILP
ncbi:MAG: amidohydrolase, partial [Sediminibacterium sp.]